MLAKEKAPLCFLTFSLKFLASVLEPVNRLCVVLDSKVSLYSSRN